MTRRRIVTSRSSWSADDEQRAAQIYVTCKRAGLNNAQTDERIAEALGKTISSVRGRRELRGATFANPTRGGNKPCEGRSTEIPDHVLADRARRAELAERQSITGCLMGDPPPGYSARKGAAMTHIPGSELSYLATPYSRYAGGIEAAFADAARLAGQLLRSGIKVYSPIAHTHPIAIHGQIDPLDHAIWLPFDEAMMKACGVLIVAHLPSWETSKGIAHEVTFFERAGKPIFDLDPATLKMVRRRLGAA